MEILIRASYPNYHMVRCYAQEGPEVFNRNVDDANNTLEGNKPGTVIYSYDKGGEWHEFPPRWYDMYLLLKADDDEREQLLRLLLAEHDGTATPAELQRLTELREKFRNDIIRYVEEHPIPDNDELVTASTDRQFSDDQISHKGRMLVELTHNCYPVPDFVILTAECFKHPEHLEERLHQAVDYLEVMTNQRLGDSSSPLVFAIRCAMPQYIPGLMPTLLNVGVTRTAYEALAASGGGSTMANRVYLSTLHTIAEMLEIENKYQVSDLALDDAGQRERIATMEQQIRNGRNDGELLLTDAFYQVYELVKHVRKFYIDNQDLILTFMQGRQASPSFILQRMVWTIGNNESYPGVLYSRHSRTGKGSQIESYRNIFGEEIMTGDVTSDDRSYTNRESIKHEFPAVYHFHPLLAKLEERYHSPVTIEFAVESRPRQLSLFSVLQLNMSELTGRAALISAIDLLREHRIERQHVMDIIKPYHLRQIVSAAIDDRSLSRLQFFGGGLSVLPRTAITAVLCFSAAKARELADKGNQVCLCLERFVPEDTIVLNEVHAILSMTPAAIHVVTACRGYGIPALLDLHNYGITMEQRDGETCLVNGDGLMLRELDHVTISSRRQALYKGDADYRPARFSKFLHGEKVELAPDEVEFFNDMKSAYETYQQIVTSQQASVIDDVDKLARLIRLELQDKPEIAREIVNSWYADHADQYVQQVLESKMGSHQDQSRVFNLLDDGRKVHFFQKVSDYCISRRLSGLKAGSFMIGRFVSKAMPTAVWNRLSDRQVAFLLNEYVLYEKYLHVLQEVGEIRLARAHSRIETEGVDSMVINNFELYAFVPLLYATHDWQLIAAALETIEHQDNTHLLVEKLSKPLDQIFDLTKPWVASEVERYRTIEN